MKMGMHRAAAALNRAPGRVRRGQTLVEFTLVSLVVFLPLVFGTIELGRGVWYYHQLSQLSREGARWVIATSSKASANPNQAGNAPGHYASVAACGCPDTAVGWIGSMDVGIPREQLIVDIMRGNAPIGSTYYHGMPVTVRLTYPYQPLAASLLNIPATLTLKAETTMQMQ